MRVSARGASLATLLSTTLAVAGLAVLPLALPASASAAEICPNAAARTGASANLPDCRAYELVTPVDKNGGEAYSEGLAEDGEALLLRSRVAMLPGLTDLDGAYSYYYTARGPVGWTTTPLGPPATEYEAPFTGGIFGEDKIGESGNDRSTLWSSRLASQRPYVSRIYLEAAPGAPLTEVGPLAPPSYAGAQPGEKELPFAPETEVVGYSRDLTHVLFTSLVHWPFDTSQVGAASLYEYVGSGNAAPLLVGVNDSGELISRCGTILGGPADENRFRGSGLHNPVSSGGTAVFFTAEACSGGPAVEELYVRLERAPGMYETVAISQPSKADCAACDTEASIRKGFKFVGASADGTKVFFQTAQPLLGGDASPNIYEYDFGAPAGERIVRVSGGDATVAQPSASVQGLVQLSEDGSHAYFVADGVLTLTPNAQGQSAVQGAPNLYVFDTETAQTKFIATLSLGDRELWGGVDQRINTTETSKEEPSGASVTPDGRLLVFTSVADLTAGDTSISAGGTQGQQIFEYDSQTGNLVRVSIGENGYNEDGNTDEGSAGIVRAQYPSGTTNYWSELTMSADGSYVFFQSTAALTPQAVNDPRKLVRNVYEYHDGNVYLLSDGRDTALTGGYQEGRGGAESEEHERSVVELIGVDASGDDVYLRTSDALVPQDTNTNSDIYDARVDGGFVATPARPACEGDACQGQLSGAPVLLSPSSELQAGGDNFVPVSTSTAPPKAQSKAKSKSQSKHKSKAKRKRGIGSHAPASKRAQRRSAAPARRTRGGKAGRS